MSTRKKGPAWRRAFFRLLVEERASRSATRTRLPPCAAFGAWADGFSPSDHWPQIILAALHDTAAFLESNRSMRHSLKMQQWVPYPVEQVFAFFANPENLPPLMPAWQRARIEQSAIVAPPSHPLQHGLAAGEGTRMTISFRPLPFSPLRMKWDARITAFAWNDHFCDEQLSGPFAYWLHCHHVLGEARDGISGVIVTDDVTYEMKFGPLGDLANMLGGALQMRGLFRYRQQQLLKLLAKK